MVAFVEYLPCFAVTLCMFVHNMCWYYKRRKVNSITRKENMNTKQIKKCIVAVLAVASVCFVNAQETSPAAESRKELIPFLIRDMIAIPGKSFKMGKYEVTQAQWEAVMGENPSRFKGDDNPVEWVSWNDCKKFIEKLNALPEVKASGLTFRLPTGAEWVYACRAGGTGGYCKLADGTEITESTLDKVAWYKDNSENKTHPVGQKKPNAFGLYDMHGNVSEWCEDLFGVVHSYRVYRGGSWGHDSGCCTAGYGNGLNSDTRNIHFGFRLASEDPEDAARKERAAKEAISRLVRDMIAIPGKSFKMGKYEVTQAQWQAVMGDNPSQFEYYDNHPVENVSWNDCKKFIEKLNALPEVMASGLTFRLPTEAEWEYACRAGGTGYYCKLANGTEITGRTLGEVAWYGGNSENKTHPVGQKKPNAFGLYDMHGNVLEWCEDLLYVADMAGDLSRVSRGGSWRDGSGRCWVSYRSCDYPKCRSNDLGFRLVASQIDVGKRMECVQSIIGNMVDIPGKNFKMGKFEVTQRQWVAVMGDNPSRFKDYDNPVENVPWNDCKKFIEKLNALPEVKASGLTFRLPTEGEWEYACRAGGTGDYCKLADGTEITESTLDEVAWYDDNSENKTHPVGQKKPNAFGLYDMHGNVWEWCEGIYGFGHSVRTTRGGSLYDDSRFCTVGGRFRNSPGIRNNDLGFRLAADQD